MVAKQRGEGLRWIYECLDLDIEVADGAVYQESEDGRLYLASGRVLLDREGRLAEWLARLASRLEEGPKPLSPSGTSAPAQT